jgi:hypothetical protein
MVLPVHHPTNVCLSMDDDKKLKISVRKCMQILNLSMLRSKYPVQDRKSLVI